MTTYPDSIPVPHSDHNGYSGSSYATDEQSCIVCGRKIKVKPTTAFVIVGAGGDTVLVRDEPDDPGFMGMQPIGSDCLRQQPQLRPYVWRGDRPIGAAVKAAQRALEGEIR